MEWFFSVWAILDCIWSVGSSATPCNIYNSLQHMAKSFCQWSHVPLYQPQPKVAVNQNKWDINTLLPYAFQIPHISPYIRSPLLKKGVTSPLLLCPEIQVQEGQLSLSCLSSRSRVCNLQVSESLMLLFFSDTLSHIWALGKLTGM